MSTRYERAFGTEWRSLPTGEIIKRAYALGVSETLGDEVEGEFERLQNAVSAAHDRDIVELAYKEGRTEALDLEPRVEDAEVWDTLVDDPETTIDAIEDLPQGLPERLERSGFLNRPADEIDAIELPDLLTRD